MDLQQLRYFIEVCDAGSFSRAAVSLDLTQPTLSRQIGLLEAELGQRLLERTGRGVIPTDSGTLLIPHARAMLDMAQRARDELRDQQASPTGRIIVGLPPRVARLLTVSLVQAFCEQFPRAVLTIHEGLSTHLREWLIAGRLDIALLFDPPASLQISCKTLRQETLVLVASAQAAPLPEQIGFAELASYSMILPSVPNALRNLVDAALRPHAVNLKIIAEVGAMQTMIPLVAQGVACTILPEPAVAAFAPQGAVQTARIGPPAIHNTLVMATTLTRPANRLTRATAQLVERLVQEDGPGPVSA
ncbi:LysR substrate-binding domain-containing protein [Achromobacter pestifer]